MKDSQENYLTRQQFISKFFVTSEHSINQWLRLGMPREMIDGVWMYPENACHRWFAGIE